MRVFHFSKAVTILFFSCLLFPFLTFFCVALLLPFVCHGTTDFEQSREETGEVQITLLDLMM